MSQFALPEQLKPPFPHAQIPNLKGFKMVMVRNDGTEVDGVVERGADGMHYVQDCLGVRLSLADYKGWKHRDTTIPGPKRIYDHSNHVPPAGGRDGGAAADPTAAQGEPGSEAGTPA